MKLCSIYQDIISFQLDSGKRLPGWLKNHCALCEDCRSFRETQNRLVHQLENEAQRSMECPSPLLRGRIMSAIDRSEPEVSPGSNGHSPFWPKLAVASVLFLLGFFLVKTAWIPQRQNPESAIEVAVSGASQGDGQSLYSIATIKPLEEWSVALNRPLEDEMDYAIADVKNAVNALADTFLTEEMKSSLLVASRN